MQVGLVLEVQVLEEQVEPKEFQVQEEEAKEVVEEEGHVEDVEVNWDTGEKN